MSLRLPGPVICLLYTAQWPALRRKERVNQAVDTLFPAVWALFLCGGLSVIECGGDLWSPAGVRSTPLQHKARGSGVGRPVGKFRPGCRGDLRSPAGVRSTPLQDDDRRCGMGVARWESPSNMGCRGDLRSPAGVRSTPLQDDDRRCSVGAARGRPRACKARPYSIKLEGPVWGGPSGNSIRDVGATCGRPRVCEARPYSIKLEGPV